MVSSALVKMSNEKKILHGMFKTLKIRLLHLKTIMLQSQWYSATFQKNRDLKQLWSNLSFILVLVPRVTEVCHREPQSGWLASWLRFKLDAF